MALAAFGCSDEQGAEPNPYESDPNDPVICVGDPDTSIVCKKESDFWDCSAMPNGDKKCKHKEDQAPSGGQGWSCKADGGELVCTNPDPNAAPPGGGDWTCSNDGKVATCKKGAPVPPGGGTWGCTYDSEFSWTCTGKGTTPPQPPKAGQKICLVAVNSAGLPTPPEGAWAIINAQRVFYKKTEALYVKVALSKAFVDNTYGANTIGWPDNKHSFKDLVGSDKVEVFFNNSNGDLLMHMAIDYISESTTAKSGYGCLGVTGGDGKLFKGDAGDVLAAQSSLSVNFNQHNYVETVDSPPTDKNFTPSTTHPNWIYDVWVEIWIKWSVFGNVGPGKIYMTGIHASPSKTGQKTLLVKPGVCP